VTQAADDQYPPEEAQRRFGRHVELPATASATKTITVYRQGSDFWADPLPEMVPGTVESWLAASEDQRAVKAFMMTDEELAAIEARVNAASPGPWLTPDEAGDPYRVEVLDHEGCQIWPWGHGGGRSDDEQGERDMIFAYSARTDVPKLIAEIRRLRQITSEGKIF
jgi:hypothetical protein